MVTIRFTTELTVVPVSLNNLRRSISTVMLSSYSKQLYRMLIFKLDHCRLFDNNLQLFMLQVDRRETNLGFSAAWFQCGRYVQGVHRA